MHEQTTADPAVALLLDAGHGAGELARARTSTMQQVAELTVPELADLCVIDLLDGDV